MSETDSPATAADPAGPPRSDRDQASYSAVRAHEVAEQAEDAATRDLSEYPRTARDEPGPRSADERHRRIAEAAYFRAERRGFAPGHEHDDWLDAETSVIGSEGIPRDSSRVLVDDPAELAYWCERFALPEQRVRAAVAKVGVIVDDVERELKGTASGGHNAG